MNINYIVNILSNGGICIIPTDTVYGIICDALCEETVKKVYTLKERNFSKPMIILVSDIEMLKKYTMNINRLQRDLMNKFFPGAMTLILEKSSLIPDIVTASKKEIGIRIPNDVILRNIIKKLDRPIIATSANISSNKTITNIDLLEDSIKNNVDYIYDGGTIKACASTIVKVIGDKISIIRDGELANTIRENYKDRLN